MTRRDKVRTYVHEDIHDRVKKYSAKNSVGNYVDAYRRIITSVIDEEGNIKESPFNEESFKELKNLAEMMNEDPAETLEKMINLTSIIYDPDVALSDAPRPPERILEERNNRLNREKTTKNI